MLLAVWLLCLQVLLAEKCSKVNRRPQVQPPSFGLIQHGDKHKYAQHVQRYVASNKEIPAVCDEAVRVAIFNVNRLVDLLESRPNSAMLRKDLETLQPTVVVLRNVPPAGAELGRFESILESLNYRYRAACHASTFGNMIASRMPLIPITQADLGYGCCLLAGSVRVGEDNVAIIGTALSTNEERLAEQTKKVVRFIEASITPTHPNFVLAGNFPAVWDSVALRTIHENKGFSDVFRELKVQVPNYTFWNGRVEDYLFVSAPRGTILPDATVRKPPLGAYTFQTLSSTNLPVAVDLDGAPENPHFNDRKDRWIWTGIGSAAVFIVVLVACMIIQKVRR
ncbi:hypothetical protein PSACC_01523 [Paramicrosporidium saccamoebae]|uniref:Endonuclease/exonuclease/phosphatase domain-containing protein n=1 Tax=Paramicrosporidium saccamoebae TaxID=1246581 RepID=A0A2H9TLP5_9FUNG|nr:hypothetical protein PSACC_01523 [Paramicrosporidium saccamoebae]